MDLNEINIFHRVVREGSFTKAARTLDLPKSTVSERVAKLEERLGARLLERTTRKLRLTEAGSLYFERAARIVAEADEADAAIVELAHAPRGVVRVFSPFVVARAFLSEVICEYLATYPRVDVELVVQDRRVDLVEERFDLGVHVAGTIDPSHVARRVGFSERIYVASPAYLIRRGIPREPDELDGHDLIAIAPDRRMRFAFRRDQKTVERDLRARYAVTSVDFALQAAERGLGITVAPALLAGEPVRQGRLVRVVEAYSGGEGAVSLVYPSNRHLPVRVRLLIDLVMKRAAEIPPSVLRGEA